MRLWRAEPGLCRMAENPGTRIDYPVMSRASDPEYYLHRAFDGSRSSGGTPFLGQLSDKDSTCMIVYGHKHEKWFHVWDPG